MRKYTYKEVKEAFEAEKYKLLSTDYKNCRTKLTYECPNGHIYSMTFDGWLKGRRCYFCRANIKLSTKYVKETLEAEGYTLLSEYENSRTKFKYRCPNGHIGYMKWDHWRDGHRCPVCAGNVKVDKSIIEKEFYRESYYVLSVFSNKGRTRVKYKCPNGHIHDMYYYNWRNGYRCPSCAGNVKKSYEYIKKEIESEGYQLLSKKYINNKSKLSLICPNNHVYKVSWYEWKKLGSRCPRCSRTGESVQEDKLYRFISKYFKFKRRDRKLLLDKELDFVNDELKLAIEYCGLYWHSTKFKKYVNYHLDKLERCLDRGYKLITIFEDEWVFKPKVVMYKLKTVFNNIRNFEFDNCYISEVEYSYARRFFDCYSFKDINKSSVTFGIFINDLLVCAVNFIYNGTWIINDIAFLSNYHNIEGIYVILDYFKIKYAVSKLMLYIDRRWDIYDFYSYGFELDRIIEPKCWGIEKQRRLNSKVTKYGIWDCGYKLLIKYY